VLRLPVEALLLCLRARSLVTVGVIAAAAVLVWTSYLTWLLPSDAWDGIWYHETMLGYAIQQHGYSPISLPLTMLQQANGYPRNCEMTSLWVVILTDRRLLEIVSTLSALPVALATYTMGTRYTRDRVAAIGASVAAVLMPGTLLQFRSSYIDVHVAAFLLGAAHFCTRPRMRLRDGAAASMTLCLLLGAKSIALAWVPALAAVATARMAWGTLRQRRGSLSVRWTPALLTALGGAIVLGAMSAAVYWRNWSLFRNPLWPIAYKNAALRISWEGVTTLGSMNWRLPLANMWSRATAPPVPGSDFADTRIWGYGLAFPYVLLPLATLGAGVAIFTLARRAVLRACRPSRLGGRRRSAPEDGASSTRGVGNLLLVSAFFLYTAFMSPALWAARYNLHLITAAMLPILWLSGRALRSARLADGVCSVAIVCFLINLDWAHPGWGVDWRGALAYAQESRLERAGSPPSSWSISAPVGVARERELKAGDVVAYTDEVAFPGELWNETYSNVLVYVPEAEPPEFLDRLASSRAKWVEAAPGTSAFRALEESPEWREIGLASRNPPSSMFENAGTKSRGGRGAQVSMR
jgi:hypothetical protein